jgi:sialic acid synthase SpsE
MVNSNVLEIGKLKIGGENPIFVIAEIGLNHNQSLKMAKDLIDVAVDSGCSAAKFQTFRAEDVYIEGTRAGTYKLMDKEIPIYSLHKSLEMPESWIEVLRDYCREKGILFFTSPIGYQAVDLIEKYNVEAIKISSYECTNIPYLEYVSSKGIPIILSTGACRLSEVEEAVGIIKQYHEKLALMHCVTKYPANFASANLNVLKTLRYAFNLPTGFSDNGFIDEFNNIDFLQVPIEAAKQGADLFEIHITLDRSLPGPDHGFATEPHELLQTVDAMNRIRKEYLSGNPFDHSPLISGTTKKLTLPEEIYVRNFAFKCLYSTKSIKRGESLNTLNIGILRPGEMKRGLDPKYFKMITENNCKASRDIDAWQPISWADLLNL